MGNKKQWTALIAAFVGTLGLSVSLGVIREVRTRFHTQEERFNELLEMAIMLAENSTLAEREEILTNLQFLKVTLDGYAEVRDGQDA